jgi:basic membrane protein A and related proteins
MKKNVSRAALAALLVLIATAAFAAGATEEASGGDEPFRIAVVMPSATSDTAFSQSMWSALVAVQEEMGGEAAVELVYSENMFVVPDAAAALRDYASQGYDLVIGHGSQYGTIIEDLAPDFPETAFAWGTDVNTFGLDNVYAYTAAAEEGGYVNGVLAGLMTESGTIGVTGPIEVGDARTYINGFVQGVASVNADATVSKTWTGSFSDVALMTAAAQTHISNGADVLTGSSQSVVGSIGAALESGGVLLVRDTGRSDLARSGARRRIAGIRLDDDALGDDRERSGRRLRRRDLHPHARERRAQDRV